MNVLLIHETGYISALFGIGLSYGLTSGMSIVELSRPAARSLLLKLENIATKLSKEHGGEDKFLRQLLVTFDITAPRYWWTEMDTYKVGTVAQSESTMHTILKRPITIADFAVDNPDSNMDYFIEVLNQLREAKKFRELIQMLPQSYMQRRIWTANYAVLKNIYEKRANHKLSEWRYFIEKSKEQILYPRFLSK